MAYEMVSQAKRKEILGGIIPAGILRDAVIKFNRVSRIWSIRFCSGAMYRVKDTDKYVKVLEVHDSILIPNVKAIDFSDWIWWCSLDSLKDKYRVCLRMPVVSNKVFRDENLITDIDKTVRWNLEQNAKYNASICKENEELEAKRQAAMDKLVTEIAYHMVFSTDGAIGLNQAHALWKTIDATPMSFDQKMELVANMCDYWVEYIG